MTAQGIELRFAKADEVTINEKEAYMYMGLRAKAPDEQVEGLFSSCLEEVKSAVSYKACFTEVTLEFPKENEVFLGFGTVRSEKLFRHLQDCKTAYIFAATAGMGIDRLISRYKILSPSKSLIIDAIGSAAVEGWCNRLNADIVNGRSAKSRFSPGYGDLSLEYQKDIIEYLDAYRKIGISLSDTLFMTPTKSVTAIIGVR
ncbi:MAG: hypothetical protein MR567_10050 [Oscillospiraceae bacterium]|nr:hypothetical protein [Oscillospiraceae bacterium]